MAAIDLSLGCIFIGVMLNIWLYGFTCVQTYIYFVRFKSDRQRMKYFVAFLFVADTVNSVLDAVFLYKYLVSNYGNIAYATRSNDEFATDPLCVSVIGFATQLFFAWRIWRLLSPHRYAWVPPAIIFTFGLMSFLGALGTTIGVVIIRTFSQFQKFQQSVIVWLACTAAADIVVTVSLITTLRRARTGFTKTDDIITRLIRNTLQTGLLTTSFAVIDLILFLASTSTLHLVFNLPLSKLYVNSLLSTLNARVSLSETERNHQHQHHGFESNLHGQTTDATASTQLKSMEAGISFGTQTFSQTASYATHKDFSPSCTTLATEAIVDGDAKGAEIEDGRNTTNSSRASQEHRSISHFLHPFSKNSAGAKQTPAPAKPQKRPSSAKSRDGKKAGVLTLEQPCSVQILTVEEKFESDLPASEQDLGGRLMSYDQGNAREHTFNRLGMNSKTDLGQADRRESVELDSESQDRFGDALMETNEDIEVNCFSFNATKSSSIEATVRNSFQRRNSGSSRHPYSQS